MSAVDFLRLCLKRWVYVVVPVVVAFLVAFIASMTADKIYVAKASTYFSLPSASSASDLLQGSSYTQQQLASYAALVTKPVVLEPVIAELDLGTSVTTLSRSVSAQASADTVIIEVSAADTSPARAASIANAVSKELQSVAERYSPKGDNGRSTVEADTVASATPPAFASSPNTKLNVAAAMLVGVFVGLLAAVARERLDTRVRTADDVPSGTALLGTVAFDRSAKEAPVVGVGTHPGARGEAYRKLRTNLRFVDVDHDQKFLVVTSSIAGEGKSSTAVNLAFVCSRAGEKVLLVDADLRRPKVAEYLGLEGGVGLVDVLAGDVDLSEVVQPWPGSSLSVLPSGTIPPNPSELLGSEAMAELKEKLSTEYDLIIFDTPPLLPVTDAAVLASDADGVVVVARAGNVRREQLRDSLASLRAVEARVFGVVLNMVREKRRSYGYSSYTS